MLSRGVFFRSVMTRTPSFVRDLTRREMSTTPFMDRSRSWIAAVPRADSMLEMLVAPTSNAEQYRCAYAQLRQEIIDRMDGRSLPPCSDNVLWASDATLWAAEIADFLELSTDRVAFLSVNESHWPGFSDLLRMCYVQSVEHIALHPVRDMRIA